MARREKLVQIGQRRDEIWNMLCDEFMVRFTTGEAVDMIATAFHVSRKTAEIWFDALAWNWLKPGQSDLVRFRKGLYGWSNQ